MTCQLPLYAIQQQSVSPQQSASQHDRAASVDQNSAQSLHLNGVDEIGLDQMPESLLISVMSFMPLRAVSNVRLVNRNFNEIGKEAIHLKLQEAGVSGQSFEETVKNARQFEQQASTQKKNNQLLMDRAQKTLDNSPSKSVTMDVSYLPMGSTHQYPRLKNILENSAALDRYKHQLTDSYSRTQLIGMRLASAPLKVKVSARQYREELQTQKDGLDHLRLNAHNHDSIMKDLNQGIQNMAKHEPNGNRIQLGVFYLPNISHLPQSPEKAVQPSAYDKFMEEVGDSIASKYAVNIPGIAEDQGAQTGIDVSKTSILLKVPATQLLAGAHASNLLIDQQVSANLKKLHEL